MKCISYSIFGANKERQADSFDFASYLRGLMINIRMNRLIYPEWDNVIHMDNGTYEAYQSFWEALKITPNVVIAVMPDAPLCKAMLWRMAPCFDQRYSHVLCRDVDSPPTYKEAQLVQYWINKETKAAHAITDSVSHTIPMMGGMIGFMPKYFSLKTDWYSWKEMMMNQDYPWEVKGSDQEFLNRRVYPKFAQPGTDSITQHYLLGHGNTFLSDWHNTVPDIELSIGSEMKESNDVCGHIGSAGFYEPPMFRFLQKFRGRFNDLMEIESAHKEIFYWNV